MRKMFMSLRFKLIFYVLLAALPALALTLYTGFEQRQEAATAVEGEVLTLARVAAVNQTMFLENTRMFMTTLAHLPSLQEETTDFCDELFTHLVRDHHPYYATMYVADTNAKVLCSAAGTHIPPHLEKCPHYQKSIKANDFVIGDYHICDVTGMAILGIGYPIMDDSGEVRLVLHISLDLAWINELAAEAQLPAGSTLNVFDKEGTILSSYPDPLVPGRRTLAPSSFLYQLLQGEEGTAVGPGLDDVRRVYSITPMGGASEDVYVALGIPVDYAFAEANRTLQRNLLILVVMTLLALTAAWVLGDLFILRQVRSLGDATQRLAAGDLETRSEIAYDDGEIGQLGKAFDQMAEAISQHENERNRAEETLREYSRNLERSNRDLQDFANIAAHDLQEPLRKIQTFGDLLKERYGTKLDESGIGYLKRVTDSARRMQSLILDLSTYSRVTSKAHPFEIVDLNELVSHVLTDLEIQILEAKAKIETDGLCTLEADATQIRQLLQNLLSNALKFRKDGQEAQVKISCRVFNEEPARSGFEKATRCCELKISDQGIGFSEKYGDRIFQPFQRLHERGEYEGTGMGLAICRKIVERHRGQISVKSRPGEGTTFYVTLPVSQNTNGK